MTVVDDVKARTDIVDLIQSRVPLKKAGRNFKANCPFHNENTPSFIVFPERGSWHCFGACGTGGDAFSFIQRADNLTFSEALSRLAERAGVTIPDNRRQDEAQRKENDVLYTALQNAADYFHRILTHSPAGEQARRYLQQRGINDETINDFQLGVAPRGGGSLKAHLADLGHTEEQMIAAGLIIERDGDREGSYDRFRERLMFPIRDGKGRVIGFGARALDDSQPKYLNSPQTPLFDKSGALFAIDRAEQVIRAEGEVVLVEGYMDALQAHQAGFGNVVAIMGTALTERQVSLVRNMARRYALALDPDTAGEEATRRSLEGAFDIFRREVVRVSNSAVPMGVRRELPKLRIINLPTDRDPDDVIRNDPDDWRKRVEEATPILAYLIQREAAQPEAATPEGRLEAVNRIFPLITALDNPFEQQQAFSSLAAALKIEERTLEAAVGRPERRQRPRRQDQANRSAPTQNGELPAIGADALKENRSDAIERQLLALVLTYDNEIFDAWQRLDLPEVPPHFFWDPQFRDMWQILNTADPVTRAEVLVSSDAEDLRKDIRSPLDRRGQSKALSDVVRGMWERQLKKDELEAAEAVASLAEDDGEEADTLRAITDEMRAQFSERIEQLRAVQYGTWNRNTRNE
ncbi:MAG: DNA primase [Chloroflexi bacterium]|nr:DNA primase [Chloroflexota bacterium]